MITSAAIRTLEERYAACVEMRLDDEAARLARELGVTPEETSAHIAALQEWDETAPPFAVDDYAAIAPGLFDPRILDQGEVWVDFLRRPHIIADRDGFTDESLVNAVAWLREHAWRWVPATDATVFGPRYAGEWLEDRPLMRALRDEAARRRIPLPS